MEATLHKDKAYTNNIVGRPARGRYGGRGRGQQRRYDPPARGSSQVEKGSTDNAQGSVRSASLPMRGNARFPNPVYPNRMDFCFYHRTFGRDARNHDLPCAWVFPNKK